MPTEKTVTASILIIRLQCLAVGLLAAWAGRRLILTN
jgi:hypothetical protein